MKLDTALLKETNTSIPDKLRNAIVSSLDADKAEDIVVINLAGKATIADYIVIVSGNSSRHVGALAGKLIRKLKELGLNDIDAEGVPQNDWVLVDAGDIIVHIFKPEVRQFYDIEGMWGVQTPQIRIPKAEERADSV